MKQVLSRAAVALVLLFSTGLTSAHASNVDILVNGDFENGVTSSTIGSTNAFVPVGWTANAGFDFSQAFNNVTNAQAHTGSNSLSIGNFDFQSLAAISQTLNTVVGATYVTTFFAKNDDLGTDPNAFMKLSIDGVAKSTLDDSIGNVFTAETFSFTGTGTDTLEIAATTSSTEWFIDSVSVVGPSPSAVPLPPAFVLFLTALVGLGLFNAAKRQNAA